MSKPRQPRKGKRGGKKGDGKSKKSRRPISFKPKKLPKRTKSRTFGFNPYRPLATLVAAYQKAGFPIGDYEAEAFESSKPLMKLHRLTVYFKEPQSWEDNKEVIRITDPLWSLLPYYRHSTYAQVKIGLNYEPSDMNVVVVNTFWKSIARAQGFIATVSHSASAIRYWRNKRKYKEPSIYAIELIVRYDNG